MLHYSTANFPAVEWNTSVIGMEFSMRSYAAQEGKFTKATGGRKFFVASWTVNKPIISFQKSLKKYATSFQQQSRTRRTEHLRKKENSMFLWNTVTNILRIIFLFAHRLSWNIPPWSGEPRFEPGLFRIAGRRTNDCAKPHSDWATPSYVYLRRIRLSNAKPFPYGISG